MTDTITIHRSENGEYRWTRRAENHEVVGASTEGYVDKDDAEANITSTQGGEFTIVDSTLDTD